MGTPAQTQLTVILRWDEEGLQAQQRQHRTGLCAAQRNPAAMLVTPARRNTPIARLPRVASPADQTQYGPGSGPRQR
jgi:hypothetical protein